MLVQEMMTPNPMCCRAETTVQDVARMMVECDCGEIPVTNDEGHAMGVVTDRDITCRLVAEGLDGNQVTAQQIMSMPVMTVHIDSDVAEACHTMQDNMIRRLVVIDHNGRVCGIITQADIALKTPGFAGDVLEGVSQPTEHASSVS